MVYRAQVPDGQDEGVKESTPTASAGTPCLHCVRRCRTAIGPRVEGFTAEGFLHGNDIPFPHPSLTPGPSPDPPQQPLAEQVQSTTANEKPSANPDSCDDRDGLER